MTRPVLLSYRTLGLGDLLTAVPALRGLRAAYPEHEHVLITPAWLGPLVALIPAVDTHVAAEELAPVPDGVAQPDVAAALHGCGPESVRRVLATRPRRLIAHACPGVHDPPEAPRWDPDDHEVVRWCRLLAAHGIPAVPSDLDITTPASAAEHLAGGATLIHPGAKAPARRWPPERFAAVARRERSQGRDVLITGSSSELGIAEEVAGRAGLPPSAVLAGRLDLARLAQVVAEADRLVSGDTGIAHLATAVGTPSVVLFGPTSPARWGPPAERRDRHRVLWAGREGDAQGHETDPGLLEITVDDVLTELDDLERWSPAPADDALSTSSSM